MEVRTPQSRCLPPGWKQIQFPKSCVLLRFLQYQMMDKVQKLSNPDNYNGVGMVSLAEKYLSRILA
jgi:hypothetical protein